MQFSPAMSALDYFRLAYVPDRLPGGGHRTTRAEYESQLAKLERYHTRWLATLGEAPRPLVLADLSDQLLKFAMQADVEAGNSASTANKLYRHIKAIGDHAWGADLAPRIRSKRYKELKREPRAWLPEEVAAIVQAAMVLPGLVGDTPALVGEGVVTRCRAARPFGEVAARVYWTAFVLTKLSLGVRISAHMAIPTQQLDLARGQLLVPAPTQKQRADQVFDLLPSAVEALAALAPAARGLPTLFADWPFDQREGWRALRRHHEVLLVRAGLFASIAEVSRADHFHKYRKTVATEIAAQKGVDAARVYLGHSSVQVTERYLDARRLARVKISEVLTDPLPPRPQLRLFAG